ncbi:MAG: DNA translocase FtsK [Pirellulaceae bacterium]
MLQRALGIGYGRAARLIDFMAEDGIVGQYAGSQAREVQISISDWEAMRGGASDEPAAPTRSNKILPVEAKPAPRKSSSPSPQPHRPNQSKSLMR